jgi:hypothetical protein
MESSSHCLSGGSLAPFGVPFRRCIINVIVCGGLKTLCRKSCCNPRIEVGSGMRDGRQGLRAKRRKKRRFMKGIAFAILGALVNTQFPISAPGLRRGRFCASSARYKPYRTKHKRARISLRRPLIFSCSSSCKLLRQGRPSQNMELGQNCYQRRAEECSGRLHKPYFQTNRALWTRELLPRCEIKVVKLVLLQAAATYYF